MFNLDSEVGELDLDGSVALAAAYEEYQKDMVLLNSLDELGSAKLDGKGKLSKLTDLLADTDLALELPSLEADEISEEVAMESIGKAMAKIVDRVRKAIRKLVKSMKVRVAGVTDFFRKNNSIVRGLKDALDDKTMSLDPIAGAKWSLPICTSKNVEKDILSLSNVMSRTVTAHRLDEHTKILRRMVGDELDAISGKVIEVNHMSLNAMEVTRKGVVPKKLKKFKEEDNLVFSTTPVIGDWVFSVVMSANQLTYRGDFIESNDLQKEMPPLNRKEAKSLCDALLDIDATYSNLSKDYESTFNSMIAVEDFLDVLHISDAYGRSELDRLITIAQNMYAFSYAGMYERLEHLKKCYRACIRYIRESIA